MQIQKFQILNGRGEFGAGHYFRFGMFQLFLPN